MIENIMLVDLNAFLLNETWCFLSINMLRKKLLLNNLLLPLNKTILKEKSEASNLPRKLKHLRNRLQ